MLLVLIFVGALGYVITMSARKRRDPNMKMTVAQKIGVGIAIVVSAFGLFVLGAMVFFVMAMSSYGSNK